MVTACIFLCLGLPAASIDGEFLWPVESDTIEMHFGQCWPYLKDLSGRPQIHAGVDIAAAFGAPVRAAADGRVTSVRRFAVSRGARWVAIEHRIGDETVTTVYWHVRPAACLVRDCRVAQGQVIGYVEGWRSDMHIHFAVWRGPMTHFPPPLALSRQDAVAMFKPAFPGEYVDPLSIAYQRGQSAESESVAVRPSKAK
jgi:murein DD-endopeptidase MepM/ murein hydrolase activator NlpD